MTYSPTHSRLIQEVGDIGDFHDWVNPPYAKSGDQSGILQYENGEKYSHGHKRDRHGIYRTGGAFLVYKSGYQITGDFHVCCRSGTVGRFAYKGSYTILASEVSFVLNGFGSRDTLDQQAEKARNYGAKAYAALKPDTPDFTGVSSFVELKETFNPLKSKVKFMRDRVKRRQWRMFHRTKRGWWLTEHAEMYIAINFGWLPLYSDVKSFAKAFSNGKHRLEELLRNEGKPVRRRRNLDGSKSVGSSTSSHSTAAGAHPSMRPTHVAQCYWSAGGYDTSRSYNTDSYTWCAGRSRYILPKGPDGKLWDRRKITRRLLGFQLTPSQVYNLIPWSWCVDYFSGLGDFMKAVSPGVADRVWFDYAYIMHRVQIYGEGTYTASIRGSGSQDKVSVRLHAYREYKSRIAASPFGWGLESPSSYQMSMLGALGYSRLP